MLVRKAMYFVSWEINKIIWNSFDRISVDEGIELVYLKSSNPLQVSFVLLQIEAGAGNVCFSITLLDQPIAKILGGRGIMLGSCTPGVRASPDRLARRRSFFLFAVFCSNLASA
jgi:hypothetical protein